MDAFPEGGLCLLAWKKRSGLGKYYTKPWEERWIVLAGNSLQYYKLGEEGGSPRGSIDLMHQKVRVQVAAPDTENSTPSSHLVDIIMEGINDRQPSGGDIGAVQQSPSSPKTLLSLTWQLCFYSQEDLMTFLDKTHALLEQTGQILSKDADRFEHDFVQGDHIYRWEMIVCPPVIYPIQIHGIVLEAGRNCVVLADFGLTGYGAKKGNKYNFAGDSKDTNAILAAWHKLRPNSQNQRLVVTTLTDPKDIRKWTKARYDDKFLKEQEKKTNKLGKISKLLGGFKRKGKRKSATGSSPDKINLDKSSNHSDTNGGDTEGSESSEARSIHEIPKSDPVPIVLARVNFLLEHGEEYLPPYHVFFSNSECIAVWCKTGRWSTIQTAVFLTTNSVGGAKSATMATIGVAAAHALLAPVVAVGGLIWVGAPLMMLKMSQEKWEEATTLLTPLFWEHAPSSAIVAAIENWSCLGEEALDPFEYAGVTKEAEVTTVSDVDENEGDVVSSDKSKEPHLLPVEDDEENKVTLTT